MIEQYDKIRAIVTAIASNKGRALLVGGAVRDMVMKTLTESTALWQTMTNKCLFGGPQAECNKGWGYKDIDIEVYGLSENELEKILQSFGAVSSVGKSFGVLRIHGLNVDWSLPREDSAGRKPIVTVDPYMSIKKAAQRRDLTMNAMAFDIITQELIDPWGGRDDIANKILRTADPHFFIEDPLRFYRVMQFIGRFDMKPDDTLHQLCITMDISTVSRERIEEEFKKLLLHSERPSLGIRWLQSIGRLQEILPELAHTIGVLQEGKWHPEGDVFEHSMQALDAAALIAKKYDNEFNTLILLYAALCHDLGKVTTTKTVNGVIKSIGHEKESKRLARTMMRRITHNNDLINAVCSLVLYHMAPLQFTKNKAGLPAYKRLANKLDEQVNMAMLIDLCIADKRGRNGASTMPLTINFPDVALFKEKAEHANVLYNKIEPILKGADIIDIVPAGPQMGNLLKYAYQVQIEKNITNKQELKEVIVKGRENKKHNY